METNYKTLGIKSFFTYLKKDGILLWLHDGKLRYKDTNNKLNSELLSTMKARKDELTAFLGELNTSIKKPTEQLNIQNKSIQKAPLSPAQKRLWFIDKYEADNKDLYNIPLAFSLIGELNLEALEFSFNFLIKKHESLRTFIKEDNNGSPYQYVNEYKDDVKIKLEFEEINELNIKEILCKRAQYSFLLSEEPLIKVSIFKLKNNLNSYILFINQHHIISDGWSVGILLKELSDVYNNYINGKKPNQTECQFHYTNYAIQQNKKLVEQHFQINLNYWKKQLTGIEPLNIPTFKARPLKQSYKGDRLEIKIEKDLFRQISKFCQTTGTTLFTFFLACYYILLRKYTGQKDIVIGSAHANREDEHTDNIIGFFINTLPLRINYSAGTFYSLLNKVKKVCIDAYANKDIPFEKVVKELNIKRDLSRNPIFQTMVSLQNFNNHKNFKLNNIKIAPYTFGHKKSVLDLSFELKQAKDHLTGVIIFNTDILTFQFIDNLQNHLKNILYEVSINPDIAINKINMLTLKERKTMLYEWNQTKCPLPKTKTIHELFEETAKKYPESNALIFENKNLTYKQLNEMSNLIANRLVAEYRKYWKEELIKDTLIGIYFDRSVEMIAGILGILKAGAAYVPFDTGEPDQRLIFKINDSRCKCIISTQNKIKKLKHLSQINCFLFNIESKLNNAQHEDLLNLKRIYDPSDLAYVIYTSGSTGNPKGVMIEHNNVINLVKTHAVYKNRINVVHMIPFAFDVSVEVLFSSLLSGSTLYLIKETTNLEVLSKLIQNTKIHSITIPAAMLSNFDKKTLKCLDNIIIGGSSCDQELINNYLQYIDIINEYGPTEATVTSTRINLNSEIKSNVIGKPVGNKTIYILDSDMNPVPIGVIGELFIGGNGIARGYLNRPKLTSERFINNCYATGKEKQKKRNLRLYKTGDLCRYLPDGNIEFIGRNDDQVKIRGFRIEPEEIAAKLNSYDTIEKAIVICKEKNNHKYLIAYYVTNQQTQLSKLNDNLKEYLSDKLPDYMIPAVFIKLDKLPLNTSGKIDKNALPAPDFTSDIENYKEPSNETERKLCKLWQQVLRLDKIGVNDDFFKLGGDSIISISLVTKMRKYGFNCSVKDIFEYKTIASLMKGAISKNNSKVLSVEKGILEGEFELLPIQKWFFEKSLTNIDHWNQSFLLKIPNLDIDKLKDCINKLVNHHDALRLTFNDNKQKYQKDIAIPLLKVLDRSNLSENKLDTILTDWQKSFNINNGPLWQIGYIYGYRDNTARLYFAFHHLIIDSVSWRILTEDIKALYTNTKLSQKTSSYRQWVNCVKHYAQNNSQQEKYWEKILTDSLDYNIYNTGSISRANIILNKNKTSTLLKSTAAAYNTKINDLLLTALSYTLNQWNNQKDNFITLESHGREDIDDTIDISNTIGWFTTAYPLRLSCTGNLPYDIKFTKESLRKIPDKGIGFLALKYSKNSSLISLKLPLISFNYLGQFDNNEKLWQVSSESSGKTISNKNKDESILSINGKVIDSKLVFYFKSKFNAEDTENIAQSFKLNLLNIIKHCSTKLKPEFTPSDFSSVNLTIRLLDKLQEKFKIEAIYPANSLQQGFIYHALAYPNDDAYRVQVLYDIAGTLDASLYNKAWNLAVTKYPSLRTSFNYEDNIIQIIHKESTVDFYYHDISDKKNKDKAIQFIQESDREVPYDLTSPKLLRIHLIKHSDLYYTVLKSAHHSITDGWSSPIVLEFVHKCYSKLLINKYFTVTQEKTYLEAQEYYCKNYESCNQYWQNEIHKNISANDISLFFNKKVVPDSIRNISSLHEHKIKIGENKYSRLLKLAETEGITLNVILQFMWHKILSICTSNNTTIVGTTVSGRTIDVDNLDKSAGLYINTLPLIIEWDECSIKEQLNKIQKKISDINTYSFINLSKLQHKSKRLFHSIFIFENYPVPPKNNNDSLKLSYRYSVEKFDYPIGIVIKEKSKSLIINIKYAKDYINKNIPKKLETYFNVLIEQIIKNINCSHNKLSLLTETEYNKIVYKWNNTCTPYPKNKTVHQLFEEQAEKTPNNIAIVHGNKQLSYRELNECANQLAHTIRKEYQLRWGKKIRRDTLIGIYIDRSIEMITGLLGILKSGAAYVPFDTADPEERLKYKVNDCECEMVITSSAQAKNLIFLSDMDTLALAVDAYRNQIKKASKLNPSNINKSTDLAYVIYTSGSTGKPKGVMIEHRNVTNFLNSLNSIFSFKKTYNGLLVSNQAFDVSVHDIFSIISFGGTLHLYDKYELADKNKLYKILLNKKINSCYIPPYMLGDLHELIISNKSALSLRRMLVGVEPIKHSILSDMIKATEGLNIINGYGPTETTVCSTFYLVDTGDKYNRTPIGKPLNNSSVYVLNSDMNPVPVGISGELYIGGDGLGRGYLNRPELTFDRFLINPFMSEEDKLKGRNSKIYKTGDVVKWLPGGNLEFVGRNDNQIKIRGFRVELGEIEDKLSNYPSVTQCIILCKEHDNNNKYLAAYYLADKKILHEELSNYLKNILPDYMIPSSFIYMDSFPLNASGKIDKKLLPDPVLKASEESYIAPNTELEKKLCKIWQDVLNVEKIGINDDFFMIGGDSISAIKVINTINKKLKYQITINQLLNFKTISNLLTGITNSKDYQPIIHMCNQHINKKLPNLFFIHPGSGGCEVYSELAQTLNSQFNCYGIDNHNLNSNEKIKNLNSLAKYYLNLIKKTQINPPFNLIGWSLGGIIALEIAAILERNGENRINVILLDTILPDKFINEFRAGIDNNYATKSLRKHLISLGLETDYIERIISNAPVERNIGTQKISHYLQNTQVFLIKAMLRDNSVEYMKKISDYVLNLPNNNIDKCCKKLVKKGLICEHGNILTKNNEIDSIIKSFTANFNLY